MRLYFGAATLHFPGLEQTKHPINSTPRLGPATATSQNQRIDCRIIFYFKHSAERLFNYKVAFERRGCVAKGNISAREVLQIQQWWRDCWSFACYPREMENNFFDSRFLSDEAIKQRAKLVNGIEKDHLCVWHILRRFWCRSKVTLHCEWKFPFWN